MRPGALRARARRLLAVLGAALLAGCAQLGLGSGPAAPPLPAPSGELRAPSRVVMVSVTGLVPDVYRVPPAGTPGAAGPDFAGAAMPTVARLAWEGIAAERVAPVVPVSSYPVHATLATGRTPSRHGVTADRLLGDRGSAWRVPSRRSPVRGQTLWQAVSATGRRVALLGWPGSSGAEVALSFPEVFLAAVGSGWPDWLADHASPALLDEVRRHGGEEPDVAVPGAPRDALLVELACSALGSEAPPALVMLHLSQAEPALLAAGPGSREVQAALEAADRGIARLLSCLEAEGFLDSTAVVVAGVHGARPVASAVSPNAVLAEVGLVIPAVDGVAIQHWRAFARSNGASALVYARSEEDARLARRALALAGRESGAFRVVPAATLAAAGADPEAWFGLEAESGHRFDDAISPPLVHPATVRGEWGQLEETAEVEPGFAAWGRGVRRGVRLPALRLTDVAPTVAALLGIALEAEDGQALVGALALPDVALPPTAAREGAGPGR